MSDNNFNITPDMINNLVNMLKSNEDATNTTNNSQIFNELKDSFSKKSDSSYSETSTNSNSIDFDTILKIKSVIETLNKKDDPRSNLLYSLKPYLREQKQKKLDQYVNLLKITEITSLFKNEKGDEN